MCVRARVCVCVCVCVCARVRMVVARSAVDAAAEGEGVMLTSLDTPAVKAGENREDEVYDHMKVEFLRLAGRLEQMAKDEKLEGAAFIYDKLNATCIACHQYLRDELPKTKTE